MQRARSDRLQGYGVRVATFIVALAATALVPIASGAPASAATLDRVKQAGKLNLGYRADAQPFSYKDASGNADGYAVQLCKDVADKLKADLGVSNLSVE